MIVRRSYLERIALKSSEGEFIYEMENSYELSPKLSQEDNEVLKEYGRIQLRRIKIQRITEEAIEQEGVLSQEDLSKYLSCTVRTIQRDIRELKKEEIEIITRGALHNIGRGQTHKVKIISMYLDGSTYTEIKRKMRHSLGAIKRYLENFTKVLMCQKSGIYYYKEIALVTGMSQTMVKQYAVLIKESRKDKTRRINLKELESRSSYREGIKKTVKLYSRPLAAMMGD